MPAEQPPGDPPPAEHAVVDRIEGDQAVLLAGDDEHEIIMPASTLPPGAGEGAWLRIRRPTPDRVEITGLDPDAAARQRARLRERTDRLRRERGGGRFGG